MYRERFHRFHHITSQDNDLNMAPPVKVGLMGYSSSTRVFHLPYILPNPDIEVVAFLQRAEAPQDTTNVETGQHCTIDSTQRQSISIIVKVSNYDSSDNRHSPAVIFSGKVPSQPGS